MVSNRVIQSDIELSDGRTLRCYDAGSDRADSLPVFWQHGTPNIGAPPEPLFAAADRLGIRWVSHDRPGYGGSTRDSGRDVASVAGDLAAVADALGIGRFAVMGHSGGGPHALACRSALSDRVVAVVSGSGMAPYGADGLDWFAGMWPTGAAELRAALAGPDALADILTTGEFDPEVFTPADHAMLNGPWSWLDGIVEAALAGGIGGAVDDDLAFVRPWGFDLTAAGPPVLLLHGQSDRIVPSAHSQWLAQQLGSAELWLRPDDGHLSILDSAADAMSWLREKFDRR